MLKDHKAMTLVRLELAAPRSRVKHSTTELPYFVSCLHVRKNVEEILIRFPRACSFYYGCIVKKINRLLNIDH